jgi:hypothetical protein
MDKLYAKLSEQHALLQQKTEAKSSDDEALFNQGINHHSSSSSLPLTPAAEGVSAPSAPTTRSASATSNDSQINNEEILRLKLELAKAQSKISRLDQELAQTRLAGQDGGRVTPSLISESDFSSAMTALASPPASRIVTVPALLGATKPPLTREHSWMIQDDTRSDASDSLSTGGFNRARGIWGNNKTVPTSHFSQSQMMGDGVQPVPWANNRAINPNYEPAFAPPSVDMYRQDRMAPDQDMMRPTGRRGNRYDSRFGPSNNFGGGFAGFNMGTGQYEPTYAAGLQGTVSGGMGLGLYPPYQQQAVGTPLSPHATEFTSTGAPWKTEVSVTPRLTVHDRIADPAVHVAKSLASEAQTYVSPTTEPLNYRRLLDRNVTCDWKYIVDKIVCNNDQQASIFLQQKLKVGTPEQKYDIVEAIVAQAYPLMINRFGNFLVQRCFEHGTPEQVIKIAEAIRGNTLNLSMDPFGCHVIQKAFDSVPEDYKAIMVHELLRRIPETVIHRYACHVWQKLFELRWTESPPQIMKYVNEALRGMWHEVALGETGSLVVQNIFENCLEEDKVRSPLLPEPLQVANGDVTAAVH